MSFLFFNMAWLFSHPSVFRSPNGGFPPYFHAEKACFALNSYHKAPCALLLCVLEGKNIGSLRQVSEVDGLILV